MLERYCSGVDIVLQSTNPVDAISKLKEISIDVLFLDIRMPGLNGFKMLEELGGYDFEVIFVTAFDDYALRALKISALDYILKPIDVAELKLALSKVGHRNKSMHKKQTALLQNYLTNQEVAQIALPQTASIELVRINDIVYCQAESNYTNFILVSGAKMLVCKTLKEYERLLKTYHFIRTHQSFLINPIFIRQVLNSSNQIVLTTH